MLKQIKPAILSVMVMTVVLGFGFPFAITLVARVVFPRQAGGSLIVRQGRIIGSEIIGQGFSGTGYFHPRPSAAGGGYDATASGGTNLGPNSDKLINGIHQKLPDGKDSPGNFDGIRDLAAAYRLENGLPPNAPVPATPCPARPAAWTRISVRPMLLSRRPGWRGRGGCPRIRCGGWWTRTRKDASSASWASRA